ncbi:MAG: carbohydrate binding domain-containing protein [Sedimentisphaerales bacterium]|nr:carbohydrate binding domain-containing protein [Sedimentisphaerales bacterium]
MYSRVDAEFVPFVIPAKPDANSPIAVTSYKPILTDSDRLIADGGHFYRAGQRVRLWGVNLSFGANLPTHEDAPYIAARMAAAGVNTVRCHHLDTSRWPRGIWNATNGKDIEPEALDRLDFFVNQLALHGIFVNINLHVGREHSEYIGLPQTNRDYDKISNIFTPALVDAQKDYARQLLSHVNPYRGVRYADDPAVAIFEITNENSFFMWSSDETLRTLPVYYADILQEQFNAWLVNRYGSNDKLSDSWSEGAQQLGEDLLINGELQITGPAGSVPQNWRLEQHEDCRASLSRCQYRSKDALFIEIADADDTQWHLQFNQGGISLEAGQYYTVIFEAASDQSRELGCNVGQAESPWGNLGLSRQAELTNEWQTFSFGFVARADENNARVNFAFSGSAAPVYLANVQFHPGGRIGLAEGEKLDSGSVALYADNESSRRTIDRMLFLAETEKNYFDGMRDYIKSNLGSGALVNGTIVFGPLGLYAQSDMDFIDTHAYWQHPSFPGEPWDAGNWLINQKPMVDYSDEATIFNLAASRLADKPFTLSEYNHPAPLDSQAGCVPLIASFAAIQDWDGIWLYTYSHSSHEWDREYMNSYFDVDTNPAKWGFMRAGTAIFRNAGIQPLSGVSLISLTGSEEMLSALADLHLRHDRDMFDVLAERAKIARYEMLKTQFVSTFAGQSATKEPDGSDPVLDWFVERSNGFYAVWGSSAWAFAGHANRYEASTAGRISVTSPGFVAMTVTALDDSAVNESQKILITACGRCENTGMIFSDDRRTVGRNWGGPPVRIETVAGTVALLAEQWKCQALGLDGMPKRDVPVDNGAIKLSPEYETMWYLLTR